MTREFIRIAHEFLAASGNELSPEAQRRRVVDRLADQWSTNPPENPIILAGSTGSRGTTAKLMQIVANLSQGAVILPGFDTLTPPDLWTVAEDGAIAEDHPQYRFAKLMEQFDVSVGKIEHWTDDLPPAPDRNTVISLALRPAPVTDAWLTEGPALPDLQKALADVTLLEAPDPRSEARAIAIRLREAAENHETVAVISPDRMLTRQISAILDRWGIKPDDSAGSPLHLSSPGRLLRHTAQMFQEPLTGETLLVLLKHPLTNSGSNKGQHGLFVQLLESRLRRDRVPFPDKARLVDLIKEAASRLSNPDEMRLWGEWVCSTFADRICDGSDRLEDWVDRHLELTQTVASGLDGAGSGNLWNTPAGEAALAQMTILKEAASYGGAMTASEYTNLLSGVLAEGEVRDAETPHPNVLIWGTLEARVQGADTVILAGLNEGSWPEMPNPDPWLNRAMRSTSGLLLPERRIGLSAHDFQQAAAAPKIWCSRSIRSDEAETVPARWINRLTNLIKGLPERNGPEALDDMKARGAHWLKLSKHLDPPERAAPAHRPSPRPPIYARPNRISATEIKTLIRDPYAVYAKHCLHLKELNSLVQEPDAAIRGTLIHEIMETFIHDVLQNPDRLTATHLMDVARTHFETSVPWPTVRALWLAKLGRIAEAFVQSESERLAKAKPAALERSAKAFLKIVEADTEIVAQADRIDVSASGEAFLYDYKSGQVPTKAQQRLFDKQLMIQALMIEDGSFSRLPEMRVVDARFIGVGSAYKEEPAPLDEEPLPEFRANLLALLLSHREAQLGYSSRSRMEKDSDKGFYDHLARYGEWENTDDPKPEDVS
jgi:double-strand break repair protein AddB